MEILLAILLAAAAVACARLWTGRRELLARERRLREEIGGLRRASLVPAPSPSSPDHRPLFGEPAIEPPAEIAPFAVAPLPATPGPSRPAPALPPHLVGEAERHFAALAALDEKLSRLHLPAGAAPPHAPAPPPFELDPGTEQLAAAVGRVGSAIEPFVDQGTRLKSDLASSEAAAVRVLESLEAALALAREAARQTEGLSSLVSSLSGLADRLNLLSLDASLDAGGSAPVAGRAASAEIRSLFDETRSFTRTLAARVRNATESARRSEEAFSALRGTADGARERSAAASGRGGQLTATALELETAAEALRAALDAARLEWEKHARLRSALEQRLSIERQAAGRKEREAAISAEVEEVARETVRQERQAAEELAEALRAAGATARSESP